MRPGIHRVIEGELYWAAADVVDIRLEGEGIALRAALEQYSMFVRRFAVGQARHLIRLLSGEEPTSQYVILSCHGYDGTILLPELDEQLEGTQPIHRRLTADAVREVVRLKDRVVISTGCETGTEELAAAFLDGGCSAYIAPTRAPYLHTSFTAVTLIFYGLADGRTLSEACGRLHEYDDDLAMWQLWVRERSAS